MASVAEHYERILSPVYAWMAGGAEAALAAGKAEIEDLQLELPAGALAVDLGAGFGKHAIPLARMGARVVAVDSSAELLRRAHPAGRRSRDRDRARRPVVVPFTRQRTAQRHLLHGRHVDASARAHSRRLPGAGSRRVAGTRRAASCFRFATTANRCTMKSVSSPCAATSAASSPVSSNTKRTTSWCTTSCTSARVTPGKRKVSSYRKLRLTPDRVISSLESFGFETRREQGARGMVRLIGEID